MSDVRAPIDAHLLSDILEVSTSLHPGDTLSPKVLQGIVKHVGTRAIRHSVETGSGGSTLLFSHLSEQHTVFTIEDANKSSARVRNSLLFNPDTTTFIQGPTQTTLPVYRFNHKLQLVLLDGPHAFPFPHLEYYHLYPHLEKDALLILDDIHIRSINDLFRFLKADDMFALAEVIDRTAFFRRTAAPVFDPLDDGWRLQAYNRDLLFRFVWTEELRRIIPADVRAGIKQIRRTVRRTLARAGTTETCSVEIDEPAEGANVGSTAMLRGQAIVPHGAFLWLFARRADVQGWWPQGEASITLCGGKWQHLCKFGEPRDDGHPFEIVILAVNATADARLKRWVAEGQRSGWYPPLQLPDSIPSCRPVQRTFVRCSSAG